MGKWRDKGKEELPRAFQTIERNSAACTVEDAVVIGNRKDW